MGSEVQKVLITEGRPQEASLGNRFVLLGCPLSLTWPPWNPSVGEPLAPVPWKLIRRQLGMMGTPQRWPLGPDSDTSCCMT